MRKTNEPTVLVPRPFPQKKRLMKEEKTEMIIATDNTRELREELSDKTNLSLTDEGGFVLYDTDCPMSFSVIELDRITADKDIQFITQGTFIIIVTETVCWPEWAKPEFDKLHERVFIKRPHYEF